MTGHDARLVPPAAAAWAGALAGGTDPARARDAWIAAAVLLGCAGVAAIPPRLRRAAGSLLLAAAAGALATWTATAAREAAAWLPVGEEVAVRGSAVEVREDATGLWIEVDAVAWWDPGDSGDGERRADGVVGVAFAPVDTIPEHPRAHVARGDVVTVHGRAAAGPGFGRAGILRDSVLAAIDPPDGWPGVVQRARTAFAEVTERLPDGTRGLVRGMVTGDTGELPVAQLRELRVSGLAHLTAVSGAHFAIVSGAVVAVGRRARLARVVVGVAVAATALGLASAVDGGGSVSRAVASALIGAVALVAGRPGAAIPALAGAVTLLLVSSPGLATDLGFALSVAAVAAIAVVAPVLGALLERRLARWLSQAIAITVAAQAACLPLLALIDAEIGPWAVAANAVAAPFAVPVTLTGVSALAVAAVAPGLAAVLVHVASAAAWPIAVAARAFSAAPGGELRWPDGLMGTGLAILAALPLVAAPVAPRLAVALHAACVIAILTPGLLPSALGGAARGWTVAICDVGQGDAVVVRAGGAVVMLDAGPPGDGAADCLRRLGVAAVDLLILTHDHDDHVGGVARLSARVTVREIWLPPGARDTTVVAARAAARASPPPAAGTRELRGGVAVTVLQTGPSPSSRDGTELNDSSTVAVLDADTDAGPLRTLALGDLESDGQSRLLDALAADPAARVVDVLKVAHHGSATQDPELVRAIDARVAVISVGADNDYGHPAPSALALLAHLPVLRTDRCGDILLAPTPQGVGLVQPCRSGVAG